MKTKIGIALVGIGLSLLALSFAWNSLFPIESIWTDEQAQEFTETSIDFHKQYHTEAASNKRGAEPSGRGAQKLDELRREFAAKEAQLQSARYFREKGPIVLRIAATVLCLAGAVLCRNHKPQPTR